MKVYFLIGSGIGNQVQTIPAFNLARKKYDDILVVNVEPYRMEATEVLFKGVAPVANIADVNFDKADLQIATYFAYKKVRGVPKAFGGAPNPKESEVEFNMRSTGLEYDDADFQNVDGFLDYIEPHLDAPDVILHDGFNKKLCGKLGKEKWLAKSYLYWDKLAKLLTARGLRVGSIGSPDEHIQGTEDFTGLSLDKSLAVLKGAQVVLCNDTGTYHLCNVTGTPNIVVFTFTDDVKNYDRRFHVQSELVRSDVLCSPCQTKGRSYWHHNRAKCRWVCRGAIQPSTLEEKTLDRITTMESEMSENRNSVMSNEDTIQDLRERFQSGKPFSYLRFGDADLYFINDPKFSRNRRHDANPAMSAELEMGFAIEDPDYLIGCVAGGAVFAKDKPLQEIAERYHKDKQFHSAVAVQLLYMQDPDGFISFCKDCFWGKKVLIIGGESVAKHPLVQKAFNVKASIRLTDRNAYNVLNDHMEHIEKNVPHFDIVVSALGQATRVLGYRLWKAGLRTQYFDVGSAVDALAERPLRSWIKRVPDLLPKYKKAFGL